MENGSPRGFQGLVTAIVLLVPLAACQTTMSVEEAKKVTASFSGAALVPPPRTIEDITAILDQQKRENPEAVAKVRAVADRNPPATGSPAMLAAFYYERGLAARQLGRVKQEIEDLTKALEFSQRSTGGGPDYDQILWELVRAELGGGDAVRGATYLDQLIAAVPSGRRGALIRALRTRAKLDGGAGRLEAAEGAARAAASVLDEMNRLPVRFSPELVAIWNATVLDAQAEVAGLRGRYAEAEALYRRAIATLQGNPVYARHEYVEFVMSDLVTTLLRQGRPIEAEKEARVALLSNLRKFGRYSLFTVFRLTTLATVLLAQGRYTEAEQLARAAIDICATVGTAPESLAFVLAHRELGDALVGQGRWREALAAFSAVPEEAALRLELFRTVSGNAGRALALVKTGRIDDARAILTQSLERNKGLLGETHRATAETRSLLAMADAAAGNNARALREFAEAVPLLLTNTDDVDEEVATRPAQDLRLGAILASYIGLLADIRGTPLEREAGIDAAAEAFRLADVARGRGVQRAVDAGSARAAARTPALADLGRREQDAKKQLTALQRVLADALSQPTDKQEPKDIAFLRSQIDTLQRARRGLMAQIEKEFPAYADLINPKPATADQVRAKLGRGEALIATYVADDRTFIWAIPANGEILFAAIPMGANAIVTRVERLRKALDPSAKTLGEIPPFDLAAAHALFKAVLEPVVPAWRQAQSLLVVAHGPLAQLPFSLLPTRPATLGPETGTLFANYRAVPWLARTHAITVLPSVTALTTLRSLPPGDPSRRPFVGFGDPYFNQEQARRAAAEQPQQITALAARGVPITLRNLKVEKLNSNTLAILPRLPETADEIKSVAAAMGADLGRDVFLGERANEQQVKSMDLSGYRVLAFATHGLVPGDLDGLTQPALALSAPEVAKIQGDGLLTMEEILGLRLNADWVVLSACNTASGQGQGSEAISGLGRAFFYAGARALLVTSWPVETNSARALTTDLFRRQSENARLSRGKVHQETMNALIDGRGFVDPGKNQVVFSYAHPIFWAPFELVGDGGGN